jgi:putative NADH-flavin reductase
METIMKIAVIGASGNAGSRITAELASRGHAITAIARKPEKIAAHANVTPKQGDVMDQTGLTRLLAGHDTAISSVHFLDSDPAKLIAAAKESKVGRYLVVGGAGSLEVAPGVRLVTSPNFPVVYKAEAEKGGAFLDLAAPRERPELDFPVALGPVHGRPADRQVPPRNGPAFDRFRRKKLDFLRGFRSCTRR